MFGGIYHCTGIYFFKSAQTYHPTDFITSTETMAPYFLIIRKTCRHLHLFFNVLTNTAFRKMYNAISQPVSLKMHAFNKNIQQSHFQHFRNILKTIVHIYLFIILSISFSIHDHSAYDLSQISAP